MSHRSGNIFVVAVVVFLPIAAMAQIVTESVSFQQGANYTGTTGNPYLGTVNIGIADNPNYDPAAPVGPPPFVDGSTASRLDLDGYGTDAAGVQNSWDRDALIRFDSIIGDGPGQVPPNATILSARLQLFTTTTSNDQSPGPIGVAKLLKPFDNNTRWTDPFGANGPDFGDGDLDRWVGGYEGCPVGVPQYTNVTPIVQAWVNGEPNYGFILKIASTDGWAFGATGNTNQVRRPKLWVDFTRSRSRAIVFQQGLNGYAGTSMVRMQASTTTDPNGITELGTAILAGAYLDGGASLTDAAIKFDGVFGTGANQVAPDATILKAFLMFTTTASGNAASRGRYDVHRLLVDVDWAGDGGEPYLWTDFLNADGPTEADGEIGPTLVSAEGVIWNSRAPLDVTSTVQAWQSGATNYGLLVSPGTSDATNGVDPPAPCTDGWEINWLGTDLTLSPILVVIVPTKGPDFNRDGHIDAVDLTDYFMPCASGPAVAYASGCAYADLDEDSDVDMDDFAVWQACFSGTQLPSQDCQ